MQCFSNCGAQGHGRWGVNDLGEKSCRTNTEYQTHNKSEALHCGRRLFALFLRPSLKFLSVLVCSTGLKAWKKSSETWCTNSQLRAKGPDSVFPLFCFRVLNSSCEKLHDSDCVGRSLRSGCSNVSYVWRAWFLNKVYNFFLILCAPVFWFTKFYTNTVKT